MQILLANLRVLWSSGVRPLLTHCAVPWLVKQIDFQLALVATSSFRRLWLQIRPDSALESVAPNPESCSSFCPTQRCSFLRSIRAHFLCCFDVGICRLSVFFPPSFPAAVSVFQSFRFIPGVPFKPNLICE